MKSKIICGNKEIIFSDSFICGDNESKLKICIDFMPQYKLQLNLEFEFLTEDNFNNGKQQMLISSDPTTGTFFFKIYNAENPLGVGNIHPIPIAVLGGKDAFLYFRFNRPDNTVPRLFTYSIIVDQGEVNNE